MNKIILSCAVLMLISCGKYSNDSSIITNMSPSSLIGGELTDSDVLKSTVNLEGCTASKIAPKIYLTAAHCLVNMDTAELRSNYWKNNLISIKTHYGVNKYVRVFKAYPHKTYVNHQKKNKSHGLAFVSYDIGLVEIQKEIKEIPVAELNFVKVQDNEDLIIGGYGCEEKTTSSNGRKMLKTAIVKSHLEGKAFDDFYKRDSSKIEKFNFYTQGLTSDENGASICPGDSGGPVYRNDDHSLVGVNSQYVFSDHSGISHFNTHTRIDELQDWIEDIIKGSKYRLLMPIKRRFR